MSRLSPAGRALAGRLPAGGGRLAVAALVQSLGIGLFMASSMAFYTRFVGLSAEQVGVGLAAAGVVALGASLLGGELADRYGARRVLALLYCGRAVCCAGYGFVHGFWQFVALTLAAVAVDRSAPAVLQALVAASVDEQRERTGLLAVLNVVRNAGLGIGAIAAGGALVTGTLFGYRITLGCVALAFLVAAVLVLRVPEHGVARRPERRRDGRRPPAGRQPTDRQPGERLLPDGRYLVLTGLNFLLTFFDSLLLVAMPVWVLEHTDAPAVTVSVLFAVNTGLVVLLQIPVSRFADGLRRAGRMVRWAGAVLALGSLGFAAAGACRGWPSIGWLVLAVIALSLGEVIASTAGWELSIALAPAQRRGRYLSVFNLGLSAERVLGPLVVTGALIGLGTAGWAAAAAVFLGAGVASERVALGSWRPPDELPDGTPDGTPERQPAEPPPATEALAN